MTIQEAIKGLNEVWSYACTEYDHVIIGLKPAIDMAIEALTEAELYKLALFAVIKNSTVMPAGKKLGKNMHEINKMSVETMDELIKMCDFEKLRESYKDGE